MNPYLLLGIIALSTSIFAGIISLLVSLGVSLPFAFFGVYCSGIVIMLRMQKGAMRLYDEGEIDAQSGYIEDQVTTEIPTTDPTENLPTGVIEKLA